MPPALREVDYLSNSSRILLVHCATLAVIPDERHVPYDRVFCKNFVDNFSDMHLNNMMTIMPMRITPSAMSACQTL